MKIRIASILFTIWGTIALAQSLHVVTTYPYIADLVQEIGKDHVKVHALAKGNWDPHTVIPKPSMIALLRNADLLIINGAQLEIGWLPPLLNQANNPKIQTGTKGLLDLSQFVELIEIPTSISRAQGDVHPEGNPHYYLDPERIPFLAKAIADRLGEIDPVSNAFYQHNFQLWQEAWEKKIEHWKNQMAPLKGTRVIEYHKLFDYFLKRYELVLVGTVEPLPGIPPTSRHIDALGQLLTAHSVRFILHDVYHPDSASKHVSKKFGIEMKILPHDVAAFPHIKTLEDLFDDIVRRLTHE